MFYQLKSGWEDVDLGPLQGELGGGGGEVGDGAGVSEGLGPPDLRAGEEREEVAEAVGQAVVEDQGEQGGRPLTSSQETHGGRLQEDYLGRREGIGLISLSTSSTLLPPYLTQ